MPLRVWDTFVVPIDNYAMAIVYAAGNGVDVAEGAVGGLGNTRFARRAFEYADEQGMALMMVSSDINSANHNYPTNYNEAIYVAGTVPDTAPNDACTGPGGLGPLSPVPIRSPIHPPISRTAATSSSACSTRASGSRRSSSGPAADDHLLPELEPDPVRRQGRHRPDGRHRVGQHRPVGGRRRPALGLRTTRSRINPLSGNEIRQLLTMSAEDVRPENLGTIGAPFVDKAEHRLGPAFRLRAGQPRRRDGAGGKRAAPG